MEPYVYEPLDLKGNSFRLISLAVGIGPIHCQLFHAELQDVEDCIEYEALSYTWGTSNKTHDVHIDGRILRVTENLYEALRNLRRSNEDRILWIDAMCIDQANDEERGHQVQCMGSIYQGAVRVIIWLGLPTCHSDPALRNMQHFEREARAHPRQNWQPSDTRWYDIWLSTLPLLDCDRDKLKEHQRSGIRELLNHSWFQRVWIVQEVANARAATVMCGNLSVSSRIFAIMPRLLHREPDSLSQAILDVMPGPSRQHSWWNQDRDLRTLLRKFGRSRASDPRDKVFALLGLSSDVSDDRSITPDYTQSIPEVIGQLIAFLLKFQEYDKPASPSPAWSLEHVLNILNRNQLVFNVFAWAVRGRHASVIEDLLRHEATLARSNSQVRTLLEAAAAEGDRVVLKYLLKHFECLPHHKDRALMVAILSHNIECSDLLLINDADLLAERDHNANSIKHDVECDNWGVVRMLMGPRYIASEAFIRYARRKREAELIFAFCVDIRRDDAFARKSYSEPHSDSPAPSDIERSNKPPKKNGPTFTDGEALHFAISKGYHEVVKCLLALGANTSVASLSLEAALEAAIAGGYDRVVELLVAHGSTRG